MVSHPEPDIQECEVKWAFGSTAVNKARGCEGMSVELFKTLKDDAVKIFHSICQQIWKTQQWPQAWKRIILIPIPKKGSTKECASHQTIALISHASKVKVKVAQSCLTLCHPMDYTVREILQARILEWVAYPFSKRSS